MIRPFLAAGSLAFALTATAAVEPALAQQQSPAPQPPATQAEPPAAKPEQPKATSPMPLDSSIVGKMVYSSDGQEVGEILEVGMAGGTQAIRVEMGKFLGLGPSSVIVNADALEQKADRIELTMTGDEIKDTISKQREKQQQ